MNIINETLLQKAKQNKSYNML